MLATIVELSKWGAVLADDELAAAIVDCVVHHGGLAGFGGAGRRLEHALTLGKEGSRRMWHRQSHGWRASTRRRSSP